jgi:hypothetical protein
VAAAGGSGVAEPEGGAVVRKPSYSKLQRDYARAKELPLATISWDRSHLGKRGGGSICFAGSVSSEEFDKITGLLNEILAARGKPKD